VRFEISPEAFDSVGMDRTVAANLILKRRGLRVGHSFDTNLSMPCKKPEDYGLTHIARSTM
jgi:hypothetical protein